MHDHNSFITLTYNNSNLPWNDSVDKTEFQRFMKRLRKRLRPPLRYFHCGEYGDLTRRPHYHAAIFGHDFHQDRYLWKEHKGNALYRSPLLEETWGLGFCTVQELTFNSAQYVARYVLKKINGDRARDHYTVADPLTGEIIEIEPEYATMSRNPGIGAAWIKKFQADVYPRDQVLTQGKPSLPPKFYDTKLGETDPLALEAIKDRRKSRAEERSSEYTPEKLAIKKEIQRLRLRGKTRDF